MHLLYDMFKHALYMRSPAMGHEAKKKKVKMKGKLKQFK